MVLKHSAALIAAVSLFLNSADAATFMLQAVSGHPHLGSGTAVWSSEFTDPLFRITDGRIILLPGGAILANSETRGWDTPIPVSSTNVNWSAIGFGDLGSGFTAIGAVDTRICSFTSTGLFSSCGALVGLGSTSTVLVPTDGTAYAQTTLFRQCIGNPTSFCSTPRLFHVKAFN